MKRLRIVCNTENNNVFDRPKSQRVTRFLNDQKKPISNWNIEYLPSPSTCFVFQIKIQSLMLLANNLCKYLICILNLYVLLVFSWFHVHLFSPMLSLLLALLICLHQCFNMNYPFWMHYNSQLNKHVLRFKLVSKTCM